MLVDDAQDCKVGGGSATLKRLSQAEGYGLDLKLVSKVNDCIGPPGPAIIRALKNAAELAAWARSEGFHHLRPSFWHATVIFTDSDSPRFKLDPHELRIEPGHDRQVRRMGGLVALGFQSPALAARHDVHRKAGGRWDYIVYRPHVSFAPDDGRNVLDLHPFQGPLIFGPEIMD